MKRFLISLTVAALVSSAGIVHAAPTVDDLVVKAGAARLFLAQGDANLAVLDTASRDLFIQRLGLSEAGTRLLWSRILTGAVQVRHENGDTADTLWFNPLFDSGVVAHWTRTDAQWQVQNAQPITGMALRGEDGPVKPHDLTWLKGQGDIAKALTASASATFSAAETRDWASLAQAPRNNSASLMRAYEGQRGLLRVIDTPGYAGAFALLDRLMVTGDPVANKLPVAMRTSLANYSDGARASLAPVAAYRRRDGWTIAMQSPEAPQITWLVHFMDSKDGKPALPRGFVAVGTGPAPQIATLKETAQ